MTRQIECSCHHDHGQPQGVSAGCGRYWLARLTLQSNGLYTLAIEPDLTMLPAAVALNAAVAGQDKAVQASAEKWTGAIAALCGLFSLTGIVTAKDALAGLGAASKTLVAFSLVIAAVCAAAALAGGYRAAYGWPEAVDVSDDVKLQHWFEARRKHATLAWTQLRRAVRLAFGALAALIGMVILVWFLPRSR
ncbi:hypothetical protein [Streptomyces sp. NPDC056660]|uniref:hypothetical protein n=1 Tax=Streptomyces sp. NPDC056660 TaxID=3345897 RepID=UPI00367A8FD0